MSNDAERFRERTVDCLQNIYAVVIALAWLIHQTTET